MKSLVFAAVLATALATPVVVPAAATNDCDNTKFKTCSQLFAKTLGVSLSDNATVFTIQYDQACVKSGTGAIDLTCKATDAFNSCMGGKTAGSACMTVQNLESIGLPSYSAYTYAAYGGAFAAECNPAIKPILDENIECLGKVYKSAPYNKCISDWTSAVTAHPEQICDLGQAYGNCMQTAYTGACPDPVPLAMCDVTVAAVKAMAPQCTFKCGQC